MRGEEWEQSAAKVGVELAIEKPLYPNEAAVATLRAGDAEIRGRVLDAGKADFESIRKALQEQNDQPFLILVEHMPADVGEELRLAGLNWLDIDGQMAFRDKGVYINTIRSRKQRVRARTKPRMRTGAATLMTPGRAQVVCMLLAIPELWTAPLRSIAVVSGVSLGTVQQTVRLLKQSPSYVHRDVGAVLDAFAAAFPYGLGKSLQLFQGRGQVPEHVDDMWVGGEQAVRQFVTGGNTFSGYISEPERLGRIIRANRWPKERVEPTVTIRRAFWPKGTNFFNISDDYVAAPLPLIYAELLSSGEPRLMEVSQRVKDIAVEQQPLGLRVPQ